MGINKNTRTVIEHLKKFSSQNTKWATFKSIENIRAEEVKCFVAYSQASRFCEEQNGRISDIPYKICPITDLLKRLYKIGYKQKAASPGILKTTLCERYPSLSFPTQMDDHISLPQDIYFPVIWSRIINPLIDISEWLVTLDGKPNTILYKCPEYYPVMDHFMKRTDTVSMLGIREELKLQAKLRPAPFDMYLELYRFYYHSRRACYMLDKRIEGSHPFLLPVNCFAKYSSRSKRLEFFNEHLKKIPAGKIIGEVDVRYFDIVNV